jgi:hypothetical protein
MPIIENAPLTLRSNTQAVSIEAHPGQVYAFVVNPENLPAWAVGFCRAIRWDAPTQQWIVATANGEIPIRYATDEATRSIDFHFTPAPGVEVAAFSRVVPNGVGSEYIFTQFQAAGMSDDAFAAQTRALGEELHVLRALMHARAACRT